VHQRQESQDRVVVDYLRRTLPGVMAVYRFGSTVRGEATAGSDTDIAVLMPDRLSDAVRFDVQEALAGLLHQDVDLVDLASASPVLGIQVVARGQLLYEADAEARGAFEDRTFGAYARLNEERRGILDRIAEEGTVYGR